MFFLLPLLLDFACLSNQYPDQSSMCAVMTMQDNRIAQVSSENLELLGKVSQLEKFVLEFIEKPVPTVTPSPVAVP